MAELLLGQLQHAVPTASGMSPLQPLAHALWILSIRERLEWMYSGFDLQPLAHVLWILPLRHDKVPSVAVLHVQQGAMQTIHGAVFVVIQGWEMATLRGGHL